MNQRQLPRDVRESIEDLRHIRRLVDKSGKSALFRKVSHEISHLFLIMGIAAVVIGVGMQLILDYAPPVIAGLEKPTVLWIVGGLAIAVFTAIKSLGIARAARREGYSLFGVIGQMMRADYLRLVPFAVVGALGTVLLARGGQGDYIFGFLSAAAAAMLIAFTSIVRLRSVLVLGVSALILALPATFLLHDYPFYKIAVCWGLPLIAFSRVDDGPRD